MSLWLCLRFEQLPLQCLNRSEEQPVAVLEKQRVVCANDCATELGVSAGMGTATVRALAGHCLLLERDRCAEQRSLQQLCCWAYSITPTLRSYRDDCLLLEVGGCLSLFRGLDPLLAEVSGGVGSRGYRVQYGLAATPGAAWLLSFSDALSTPDSPGQASPGQDLQQRLGRLPLTLLDEFPRQVDSLRRAGLHTLGDLFALPPAALGRRCGREFIHFLDLVLGNSEECHPDYAPPQTFTDEYWFGYEVKANQELLPAVQLLLQSFCQFLRHTQLQASEICWRLVGIDGKLRELTVRSASSHSSWENWYQLTCIRIDRLQLASGVEGLALHCDSLREGHLASLDLFAPHNQKEPLASLLDRLRSRLGLQAIEKVGCRDEHLPEFALHVSSEVTGSDDPEPVAAQRPFWLMPQPQDLRQYGSHLYWNGKLKLEYGPERIEDNWWQDAVSRDYYVASDSSGQRYWIFRDRLTHHWFIQGVFA